MIWSRAGDGDGRWSGRRASSEGKERDQPFRAKTSTPSGWLALDGDATDNRVKAEWVVRAPNGGTVKLVAKHERAGTVRAEVKLG